MRRLAIMLIALAPATSAFALNPQPEPPSKLIVKPQRLSGYGGGGATGKVQFQDFHFTKRAVPPKLLLPAK